MSKISSLGVFCGSADGKNPAFIKAAYELGQLLGKNGIRLIYGAGHTGMMGAVAEGALDAGGEVVGIINDLLQSREVQRLKLTELKVLPSTSEKTPCSKRPTHFASCPAASELWMKSLKSLR